MFRREDASALRFGLSIAVTASMLVGLSGCAPEPSEGDGASTGDSSSSASAEATSDSSGGDPNAAAGDQKSHGAASESGENGWPQQGDPQDTSKSTTLPASFPESNFVVPDGATIDDAGERSANEWYLVLSAKDRAVADELWQSISSASEFAESERSETSDGGVAASWVNIALSVTALQIPQADGSVLLSFDITAADG